MVWHGRGAIVPDAAGDADRAVPARRKDFWLKANPGKGTLVEQTAAAKLAGLQLMQATGTKLEFIPYRGG